MCAPSPKTRTTYVTKHGSGIRDSGETNKNYSRQQRRNKTDTNNCLIFLELHRLVTVQFTKRINVKGEMPRDVCSPKGFPWGLRTFGCMCQVRILAPVVSSRSAEPCHFSHNNTPQGAFIGMTVGNTSLRQNKTLTDGKQRRQNVLEITSRQ